MTGLEVPEIRILRSFLEPSPQEIKDWLLRLLARNRPVTIAMLPQDGGDPTCFDVIAESLVAKLEYIVKMNSRKQNIYFLQNVRADTGARKPKDEEIIGIDCLSVDWDFPKEVEFGDVTGLSQLLEEKANEFLESDIPPTYMNFTGNGIQAFWMLSRTYSISEGKNVAEHTRKRGEQLAHLFGGDSTFDLSRIMRLPGTVNWPNEKKRSLGKVPCGSRNIYEDPELVYSDLTVLDKLQPVGESKEDDVSNAEIRERVRSYGKIAPDDKVPSLLKKAIDPDKGRPPKKLAPLFALMNGEYQGEDTTGSGYDYGYAGVLFSFGITLAQAIYFVQQYGGEQSALCRETRKGNRAQIKHKIGQFLRAWARHEIIKEKQAASQAAKEKELIEIAQAMIWVNNTKRYFDERTLLSYDRDQLNTTFQYVHADSGRPGKFDSIFSDVNIRVVQGITIKATTEERLVKEPVLSLHGDYLNMWSFQQFMVQPEGGDFALIDEYFKKMLPNEQERKLALQFLGFVVQNPGVKLTFMLLMIGERGTGKSTLSKIMKSIFGGYAASINSSVIKEQYNRYVTDYLLVSIEELNTDDKADVWNRMKQYISETFGQIRIMRTDAYQDLYRANFIASSNYETPIFTSEDERRLLVVNTEKASVMAGFDWVSLNKLLEEKPGLFLCYLKNVDLVGFQPYRAPPVTAARLKMMQSTLRDWEREISERIGTQDPVFNRSAISYSKLAGIFQENAMRPPNANMLNAFMEKKGFVRAKVRLGNNDATVYVWNRDSFPELKDQVPINGLYRITPARYVEVDALENKKNGMLTEQEQEAMSDARVSQLAGNVIEGKFPPRT